MKKYLFITETPSTKEKFEKIYLKHKESLGYIADFIFVFTPVSNINDKTRFINLASDDCKKLKLKNMKLPDGYYVFTRYLNDNFSELKKSVNNPDYDYIVNACDTNIYGQLQYEYIKENLEFFIPDKRMIFDDLTDTRVIKALDNFVENDKYLSNIKEQI